MKFEMNFSSQLLINIIIGVYHAILENIFHLALERSYYLTVGIIVL